MFWLTTLNCWMNDACTGAFMDNIPTASFAMQWRRHWCRQLLIRGLRFRQLKGLIHGKLLQLFIIALDLQMIGRQRSGKTRHWSVICDKTRAARTSSVLTDCCMNVKPEQAKPGRPKHDPVPIRKVHRLADGNNPRDDQLRSVVCATVARGRHCKHRSACTSGASLMPSQLHLFWWSVAVHLLVILWALEWAAASVPVFSMRTTKHHNKPMQW